MYNVVIDSEKCIGCGLCKNDCVAYDIDIENKKAVYKGNNCIFCGHCEAICPQNAIKLEGFEDTVEDFDKQVLLDPKEYMDAIKTRRTIRQFKQDKEVPQEIVDMILEAGRLAPTGSNAQRTRYIVLRDKLDACEKVAVKYFRNLLGLGMIFAPKLKDLRNVIDPKFFFKGAKLAIVIIGKDQVSASLAAQNMATMAEANGLGVLFSGYFSGVSNLSPKERRMLKMKLSEKVATTLVIGYPKVKYKRTAHRKPLKVTNM